MTAAYWLFPEGSCIIGNQNDCGKMSFIGAVFTAQLKIDNGQLTTKESALRTYFKSFPKEIP